MFKSQTSIKDKHDEPVQLCSKDRAVLLLCKFSSCSEGAAGNWSWHDSKLKELSIIKHTYKQVLCCKVLKFLFKHLMILMG